MQRLCLKLDAYFTLLIKSHKRYTQQAKCKFDSSIWGTALDNYGCMPCVRPLPQGPFLSGATSEPQQSLRQPCLNWQTE